MLCGLIFTQAHAGNLIFQYKDAYGTLWDIVSVEEFKNVFVINADKCLKGVTTEQEREVFDKVLIEREVGIATAYFSDSVEMNEVRHRVGEMSADLIVVIR